MGATPWEARPPRVPPIALSDRQTGHESGQHLTRGGAVAARWAHNPKVGGSNPPPATRTKPNTALTPAPVTLITPRPAAAGDLSIPNRQRGGL